MGDFSFFGDVPRHDRTYIFTKSKIAIESDDTANRTFAHVTNSSFLQFSTNFVNDDDPKSTWGTSWHDADVFRVRSTMSIYDMAAEWADQLAAFEAWAIIDHQGNLVESPAGGPFTLAHAKLAGGAYGLIFALFNDDDKWWEQKAERLKEALSAIASPVFYPRFGRIFLINRRMDYRTIWSRIATVAKGIDIAGIDGDQHSFFNGEWRDQIWTSYPLYLPDEE